MAEEVAYGAELVLPRSALKRLVRRNNWAGLLFLLGHFSLLALTGFFVYRALHSWWLLPAMAVHGIVMAFLFAPMHELSHGTVFRFRWLNEVAFRLISFIYISPPVFFRYFHAAHHTYTQILGKDPDIVLPRPASWGDYVYYVSSIPMWRRNSTWFVSHALGRIASRDSWYVPQDEQRRVFREARVMLLLYAVIVVGSIALESVAPLVYWLIPRLMGEPVMRWMRVAEHVGCDNTADLRHNTRTTRPSLWLRGLFWNMSYHAEHHLCPAVPFHALAKMHREVGNQLHPIGTGYFAVHWQVLCETLTHSLKRTQKAKTEQ
jgi:fatty acid desaturase